MLEATQRAPVRGPTFIRLLARLSDADVSPPQASLADRLSDWIDWTRAVALARTLDGAPPSASAGAPAYDDAEAAAYAATRASLTKAIGEGLAAADDADAPADYAPLRQHYLAMQRSMLAATGRLRDRLRWQLAARSGDAARLAELDALMEAVLSPREHSLLASVPALLGEHYERLRAAASVRGDTAGDRWLAQFRKDMQDVLTAELDMRFLPLEALIAALTSQSPVRHA
ncbi:DUF3348 family protein [Lysobacter silvisoli]|uniref:DUF3348 family protein n=1 Tax=Lysobacter silvisoli TaxID=2293254 RepID=A0A371K6R5_9GAMM|nr:DUF3348 family protein [Lysobacter silvisoli]RDZ29651.1 DUF3348 family protein [Lysobacter silvisoli]